MADIMTHVYDILFPSPPALKEIASISFAVQLWRQEINSHRIKNTLSQLNLEQNIVSDDPTPRIPATIMPLIKKHIKQVGLSIKKWLKDHSDVNLFETEIFNDFDDFVGDFDGTIHYVETARKMMLCERIDQIARFKIACTYCFENDISQIWPSISSHFNKTTGDMYTSISKNRLLYYWICRLKNQLYKLHSSDGERRSVEEKFFRSHFSFPCWSSFEYFWNHVDVDVDTQNWYITRHPKSYYVPRLYFRYLLPTFNDVQLNEFANTRGYKILIAKCKDYDSEYSTPYIMAFWTYIKHKIRGDTFSLLVRKVIRKQFVFTWYKIDKSTCCNLWNTAPNHLKQHAIRDILLENGVLFQARERHNEVVDKCPSKSDPVFLLTILTDASVEDRSTFWNKYWRTLMNVLITEHFAQLMSLCFGNDEYRIAEFKLNTLSVLQNIRANCAKLLRYLRIEELNELVNFCSPDEQTRKTIRCTLLVEEFKFNRTNLSMVSSQFNDFINNAYDDEGLAAQFKIQLLSSPSTVATFKGLIASSSSSFDVSFIDILAPSQQAARELKRSYYFVPLLKQKFVASSRGTDGDDFSNFICGYLGNEDETARFKEALPVDEIVQDAIRCALSNYRSMILKYNCFLVRFLEWYFNTPQELEEFNARYADDDVFVQLTTKI